MPIKAPRTLLEAIRYFSDDRRRQPTNAAKLRRPDGFVCPACGGREYPYLTTRKLWKCKACKKQTSAKKGTIFEDYPGHKFTWCFWVSVISVKSPGKGRYRSL
ncbi:MAG: transposase [Actinomycetota bacterium]